MPNKNESVSFEIWFYTPGKDGPDTMQRIVSCWSFSLIWDEGSLDFMRRTQTFTIQSGYRDYNLKNNQWYHFTYISKMIPLIIL